jgi:hypothetical protein
VSRKSPFLGSERNSATKNFFKSSEWFSLSLNGSGKIPKLFILWLGTSSKYFSLLPSGSKRNSERFYLPRKHSEWNSELILFSAERLGTEFPAFSVLQNRRNSEERIKISKFPSVPWSAE